MLVLLIEEVQLVRLNHSFRASGRLCFEIVALLGNVKNMFCAFGHILNDICICFGEIKEDYEFSRFHTGAVT